MVPGCGLLWPGARNGETKAPLSDARPALNEMEDQNNHRDHQKNVNKAAADIGEQPHKPEYGDDNGYPKQHGILLGFA
jgi:hypothetical protein